MGRHVDFAVEQLPPGLDRTKSPLVAHLVTMADEDLAAGSARRAASIEFVGGRDEAHARTKSYRRVCGRLGYVLHYSIKPLDKKLLLWATKAV